MSAATHAHDAAHGHTAGHDHDHGHAAPHGSLKSYLIGFALSVLLTAVPFGLVMAGVLSPAVTGYLVVAFAAVQIVVHMIFFLHMNAKSEGGWTMLALIFTVVIMAIVLSGSLWVMHHLNTNMMPIHDMSDMP
ncbi:cytochrome o ubiquinol oxidase subunit IV [Phenylobacterium sp. LjRoot219]|uniref:cytochrome o ubiquinol oxidase subunit IV n=1 Tax=Phenylobacterium sp. LjRoot219 TaxID=3342283 RepID=UPI003ED0EC74